MVFTRTGRKSGWELDSVNHYLVKKRHIQSLSFNPGLLIKVWSTEELKF